MALVNQKNRFVVKGKGGIPALPTGTFGSETIMINGHPTNMAASAAYAVPTSKGNIIPARGMVKTADGQVILTATPVGNNADAERIANGSPNCG